MASKIVLVFPETEPPIAYWKNQQIDRPHPPYSILSIGSYLKEKGYEVKIIDRMMEPSDEVITKECKDAMAVGMSAMTSQIKDVLKVSELIKSKYKIPIIFGGIHPTLYPKQCCEDELIDYVVTEEGEETIYELLEWLKDKKGDINMIKGVVHKTQGEIIINPKRPKMNMEDLPPWDYSLINIEDYALGSKNKEKRISVQTSRGCPHRCSFCINIIMNNQQYRFRSKEMVMDEIDSAVKTYGVKKLQFYDENFFANKPRGKEIFKELIKRNYGLELSASCRIDYFSNGLVDDEVLSLAAKAGLTRIALGPESGSEHTLEILKKDITPKQILHAITKCREYNIRMMLGFMMGMPGETKEDVMQTIKIMKQIKKIAPETNGGISIYRPYPGGELYEAVKKTGTYEEPSNLREWVDERYSKFMTNEGGGIPWNENEKFIMNIAHYANLAFKPKYEIKDMLRKSSISMYGFVMFIFLAKLRFKLNFYSLPLDKHIYRYSRRFAK